MNETDLLITESTRRLFADLAERGLTRRSDEGAWSPESWVEVEALGLPLGLVPEEQGGFGLGSDALLGVVREAGRFAVPLPLPETMVANRLLAQAGLELPGGALSISVPPPGDMRIEGSGEIVRVSGVLRRVPWGRDVSAVVLAAELEGRPLVALLARGGYEAKPGTNLAGEPRDDLTVDTELSASAFAVGELALPPEHVRAILAALRSIAMAGAMAQVLELSVRYANERVQFGRPIGKFQAVQQNLAVLAGQAAATAGAAELAAIAVTESGSELAMGIAKMRASEAAGLSAAIAHQVHGAMGFTREHSLHLYTRRLWSWRDEFGNEAYWSRATGERAAEVGADGLWPLIASF